MPIEQAEEVNEPRLRISSDEVNDVCRLCSSLDKGSGFDFHKHKDFYGGWECSEPLLGTSFQMCIYLSSNTLGFSISQTSSTVVILASAKTNHFLNPAQHLTHTSHLSQIVSPSIMLHGVPTISQRGYLLHSPQFV